MQAKQLMNGQMQYGCKETFSPVSVKSRAKLLSHSVLALLWKRAKNVKTQLCYYTLRRHDPQIVSLHGKVATVTCGLQGKYRLQIVTETKHFHWWNVFGYMCRIGWWSLQSWFNVNRSTFDEDMHKKTIFPQFHSQWSWPLTYRPQICYPSYSCPAPCFHWIRSFYGLPISRNS